MGMTDLQKWTFKSLIFESGCFCKTYDSKKLNLKNNFATGQATNTHALSFVVEVASHCYFSSSSKGRGFDSYSRYCQMSQVHSKIQTNTIQLIANIRTIMPEPRPKPDKSNCDVKDNKLYTLCTYKLIYAFGYTICQFILKK